MSAGRSSATQGSGLHLFSHGAVQRLEAHCCRLMKHCHRWLGFHYFCMRELEMQESEGERRASGRSGMNSLPAELPEEVHAVGFLFC